MADSRTKPLIYALVGFGVGLAVTWPKARVAAAAAAAGAPSATRGRPAAANAVDVRGYLAACAEWEAAQETLRRRIRAVLRACRLPHWTGEGDIDGEDGGDERVTVERLGGAMTNLIFRCVDTARPVGEAEGEERNSPVLVRIYGKGAETFFPRDAEIATFRAISRAGHGPRLLAQFANGRVEQWIDARPLRFAEMRAPRVYRELARALAEFHATDLDVRLPDSAPGSPLLFRRLRDWEAKAREIADARGEGGRVCGVDVAVLGEEIDRLERTLAGTSPVVLCHNDLQPGNILWREEPGEATGGRALHLIDFEYGGFNFRGFDLGNYFNEWMYDYGADEAGGRPPHEPRRESYPTREQRRDFCREYLRAARDGGDDGDDDAAVEALVAEAHAFAQASSLLWVLWGLLSAADPPTPDFDYEGFTASRLELYWRQKV